MRPEKAEVRAIAATVEKTEIPSMGFTQKQKRPSGSHIASIYSS
jgi:hypothetical protein